MRKTGPKRKEVARTRITLWLPDQLGAVVDEIAETVNAETGISLARAEVARLGIIAIARTLPKVLEGQTILSIGDIEQLYQQAILDGLKSRPKS